MFFLLDILFIGLHHANEGIKFYNEIFIIKEKIRKQYQLSKSNLSK